MKPRSAQALRIAFLVLLGVASVWAFGWACATRRPVAEAAERAPSTGLGASRR